MSRRAKWEYFQSLYWRYRQASKEAKQQMLDEFCRVCHYNRKYAIRKLNGPAPADQPLARQRSIRGKTYGPTAVRVLRAVWEAAGYPWSVRLKALLPIWLPWIKQRFTLSAEHEQQLLAISARQMDRCLGPHKRKLSRRIYGRTKPGTLLKHQIPIRTDNWDVTQPGFVEIDLVSHSGNCADGEFIFSLNVTDIFTGWVETRAIMGKGQQRVSAALDEIAQALPFGLLGIDSDNGGEFINAHLHAYCHDHDIQFTRGRPYQKDDNAHIEQKNWTHVRKLFGWERYDSERALTAMNQLYRNELRVMMNLFQPSVKLIKKVRVGSRLTRRYDAAQTPLDRLSASQPSDGQKLQALRQLRNQQDPFRMSQHIETQLERIWSFAQQRHSPRAASRKASIREVFSRETKSRTKR